MVTQLGRTDVVGVHNAHNVAELVGVAPAVVEPGEVFRLLQDGRIRLIRHPAQSGNRQLQSARMTALRHACAFPAMHSM